MWRSESDRLEGIYFRGIMIVMFQRSTPYLLEVFHVQRSIADPPLPLFLPLPAGASCTAARTHGFAAGLFARRGKRPGRVDGHCGNVRRHRPLGGRGASFGRARKAISLHLPRRAKPRLFAPSRDDALRRFRTPGIGGGVPARQSRAFVLHLRPSRGSQCPHGDRLRRDGHRCGRDRPGAVYPDRCFPRRPCAVDLGVRPQALAFAHGSRRGKEPALL